MARSFRAQQLRHEAAMRARFISEHVSLAQQIASIVRAAPTERTDDGPVIQNTLRVRTMLSQRIWQQAIKPYYVGPTDDPLDGPRPVSPYARLLYDGIRGNIEIEVERHVGIVRRLLQNRPDLLRVLTAPRPIREQTDALYDPFHRFVDPNGYRLSDRIWRTSIQVRSRIDRLLDYHIGNGTPVDKIASAIEPFLQPNARGPFKNAPYGYNGSYSAYRLAQTEWNAANGRATVNAGIANPFIGGIQWALGHRHTKPDICDDRAAGGDDGDGVYSVENVPAFPAHPFCNCNLTPVTVANPAEVADAMSARMATDPSFLALIQGALNPAYMVETITHGAFDDETIEALIAPATRRRR